MRLKTKTKKTETKKTKARAKPDRLFDFKTILHADVARLFAAHTAGKVFHAAGNIKVAGDEVEVEARALLRRRLPGAYAVCEGHVVDRGLHISPQCDIIIADRTDSQVLTRTGSETEYIPYEAVYAVGEVKSTYQKWHPGEFSEKIRRIRALRREKTVLPSDQEKSVFMQRDLPPANPLFTFLLAVDSTNFDMADVADLYAQPSLLDLPTFICLLNRGCLLHVSHNPEGNDWRANPQPEALSNSSQTERGFWPARSWQFISHGDGENALVTNFGLLYFMLLTHLRTCVLEPTPMLEYLGEMFDFRPLEKVADDNAYAQALRNKKPLI